MPCRVESPVKTGSGPRATKFAIILAQVIVLGLAAIAAVGVSASLKLTEVAAAFQW